MKPGLVGGEDTAREEAQGFEAVLGGALCAEDHLLALEEEETVNFFFFGRWQEKYRWLATLTGLSMASFLQTASRNARGFALSYVLPEQATAKV